MAEEPIQAKTNNLDAGVMQRILIFQKTEITEHEIYKQLARTSKDSENRRILECISGEELKHYQYFKRYTQRDVAPSRLQIWFYVFISRVLGLTFGLKLMERGETQAEAVYTEIARIIPDVARIEKDEEAHEKAILNMIQEERLLYISSAVLGLNDALVELTGTLAGLTLALQNTRLVAIAGLITGIAASLSMAASEYLSTRQEEGHKNPVKASVYTGMTYVGTVTCLILPYFIWSNIYVCLAMSLAVAVVIIAVFTFYISVARDLQFRKRFPEMLTISLGVAAISFGIGFVIRQFLHVDA